MTEQTQSQPGDDAQRQAAPVTGDITTGEGTHPTVTGTQDDPDREGEDRFDAG